tara:strand:- start:1250 stop:1774 length:525 start_codon:yes stop_codon:yes gene_type:complete
MKIKIIKIFTCIVIVFIIGIFFFGLNKDSIYNTKGLEGSNIRNIKLDHLTKNEIISEKDFNKKGFTLINFWASWCGPCLIEHPFLIKLNDEPSLQIIGVNFKDKKENALKFLDVNGNPYDLLAKDEFGKYSINFGIYGIPESILIDENFIILKKFIGPISDKDYIFIKKIIKSS